MISANKIYKKSKSKLPFKEWLKREQLKGTMQVHDNYVNAAGATEDENVPEKTCNGGTPVWIPTLAGLAIGGALVYFFLKKKRISDS